MENVANKIGTHNIIWVTLDTLRYDAATMAMDRGVIPWLGSMMPNGRWQKRHTPGSFTYAAHHAFFAGFLPTPTTPGPHMRPFALRFAGSETTGTGTAVFDEPTIVEGLAGAGYHTICIGGVGFFNRMTPLGSVLPNLFAESHWRPELGVTDPDSTRHQVDQALACIAARSPSERMFLFLNVSAIHQPNCMYLADAERDSVESQIAALSYVDMHLCRLFEVIFQRGPGMAMIFSDHGTAYGEDGYHGHRLAHPVVWDVPYTELEWSVRQ